LPDLHGDDIRHVPPVLPSKRIYPVTHSFQPTEYCTNQLRVNENVLHQERLIDEVYVLYNLAIAELKAASESGNLVNADVYGNGFDACFTNTMEINCLIRRYHLSEDWNNLPAELWCFILAQVQRRRSSVELTYRFFTGNPTIIRR
jgi:hypothetical protein